MKSALAILALLLQAAPSLHAQDSAARLEDDAERLLSSGDYKGAARQALAAAKLLEASGKKRELGDAFSTAGAAFLYQGDHAQALTHMERALALASETGDKWARITRLNNIGGIHVFLGNYAEAYARYQAALASTAQPGAPNSDPESIKGRRFTLTNLAVLHMQLGQNQRALELYQELRASPLKLEPNMEAQMLTNLAVVLRRLGDLQKALQTHQQARALLASDPNAAASLYTLHNIGVVQALDLRDYTAALQTFRAALRLTEKHGNRQATVLERLFLGETLLRMGQPAEARAEYAAALVDSQKLQLVDEQWTALYGLGRVDVALGRPLDARREFEKAIDVIESARSRLGSISLKAEFLAAKRDVYDAQIALLLTQQPPPAAEIFRRIEEGRARNLKEALPLENAAVNLPEIQKKLDPGAMLLEYWTSGDKLAVVRITADSAVVVQRNVKPDELAAVDLLARALTERESNDWRRLANVVSRLLLVDDLPTTIRHLIVVPDGSLHRIPIEVLEGQNGKRIVEAFDVSYLPSAHFTGKRRPNASVNRRWPWELTMAAFADPLVETASPATGALYDAAWPRLEYSAAEARAVSAELPGRALLHIGADNQKHYVFDEATARMRVLHFATHAAVDANDSRRSRMLFTPVAGQPASMYLFSSEIAKLNLATVELVTLAACETERGQYVRGEGVESFSRAFLAAGAESTVSSMWRVSDLTTGRFMKRFYARLAAGDTKASALRAAKLEFLQGGGKAAHPYYWAPFLLSGDGASALSPGLSWWMLAAVCAALVLFAAALTRFLRAA